MDVDHKAYFLGGGICAFPPPSRDYISAAVFLPYQTGRQSTSLSQDPHCAEPEPINVIYEEHSCTTHPPHLWRVNMTNLTRPLKGWWLFSLTAEEGRSWPAWPEAVETRAKNCCARALCTVWTSSCQSTWCRRQCVRGRLWDPPDEAKNSKVCICSNWTCLDRVNHGCNKITIIITLTIANLWW